MCAPSTASGVGITPLQKRHKSTDRGTDEDEAGMEDDNNADADDDADDDDDDADVDVDDAGEVEQGEEVAMLVEEETATAVGVRDGDSRGEDCPALALLCRSTSTSSLREREVRGGLASSSSNTVCNTTLPRLLTGGRAGLLPLPWLPVLPVLPVLSC